MSNEHPLNICSLFTSSIYQAKIKCKGGDSYFYNNRIYRPLEIETNFFSIISFQRFLIFHICGFSENAQYFVGAFP